MNTLKQTWLYQQLEQIYGAESVTVYVNHRPPSSSEYMYFPVKEGIDTLGWVGIESTFLRDDNVQLIQVLVDYQNQFRYQDNGKEEKAWKLFLQEDLSVWKSKWEALDYPEGCQFGHVYLSIDGDAQEINGELQAALKEIVESVLEEKSFLLPVYPKQYVWIIPFLDQQQELHNTLKALVDTITAECMVNVRFYIGSPYQMPLSLNRKVKEELQVFQLAIDYGGDRSIYEFQDLSPLILLHQCTEKDLHQMIEKLIGPIKDDKELLHSIETFLKENLNVSETAKRLYIHRNSMQYRLDKFIEKTGLDIRQFEVGVSVYLAIQALGMVNK